MQAWSSDVRRFVGVRAVFHYTLQINYINPYLVCNFAYVPRHEGTTVAQWLRCCATIGKVAGSIPAGVSGFYIDIKSFRSHYGPGVDSASNRNEYQEHFLGVKAAGA